MKAASKRLFLAIPLSVGDQAAKVKAGLRLSGRVVPAQQLHVTLKFLGDVAESAIPEVEVALAAISWASFELVCGRIGAFPKRGRVRVVWLSAEGEGLDGLAAAVDRALAPWCELREQPFVGHITLARPRGAPRELRRQIAEFAIAESVYRVDAFTLYASRLTQAGAIHRKLRDFPCN
jgi:2'-5' RNA ligase